VIATLVPSEIVTLNNNNGAYTKTFSENGTFTFTFEDAAGNIGEANAQIDWISNFFQMVETDPQTPKALTQTTVYMNINYTNTTQDITLSGLGLRIHYPSSALTYQSMTNILDAPTTSATDQAETTETDDNNASTDRYIEIAWHDEGQNWPGQPLPLRLCTVAFMPASDLEVGYTCTIMYQASVTHTGYLFYADPVLLEIQRFTLDVDANQNLDALTDGLLIIRYLFGIKSGYSLVANAVDLENGLRTTSENINAYIKSSLPYLDIDDNGKADALTDGILIIRYLFGLTEGESLIGNSVDSQGSRTTSESIKTYLDGLMP
ncbi:hypothetical protein MHK_007020, partial [Candidatus Magnetomorum sp. HK-1]